MDRVCPLLGLQGDRRSAIDGVDASHRCYADEPPIPLDRQQQAQVCLTQAHEQCDRYLAHLARSIGPLGRFPSVDTLVSTRMILAPEPSWRGMAGRARRAPSSRFLAAGAGVIALGIGGVAVVTGIIDGRLGPGTAVVDQSLTPASSTPSPEAVTTPTERPSPTPTATPIETPPPTPTPTAVPSPTPTPVATPPPPPPQETYVVQQGDTLGTIAAQFGTTVGALQAANGIEDPDTIVIGEVLIIP